MEECQELRLEIHNLPLWGALGDHSHNGLQFDNQGFKEYCDKWGITLHFALMAHSQSNGLAESANKSILESQHLRKRVKDVKGMWLD